MKEMRDVVVVGYLRTAQSRSRPADPGRDVFGQIRADDLLAQVLPEVLERSRVNPEEVDDFLVGAAVGVNENWSYGCANACCGGGQGVATIIEREEYDW